LDKGVSMAVEKRKFARVPVYMKVINESKESDFGFSYAKDISLGGMALDTKVVIDKERKIAPGSVLKLKFKIPGGKLYITALGEVARIDKAKSGTDIIGVKFTSIDKEFSNEIESFVKESQKGNISLE
jgi:hypothetical protein